MRRVLLIIGAGLVVLLAVSFWYQRNLSVLSTDGQAEDLE